jgi:hypothetical protein
MSFFFWPLYCLFLVLLMLSNWSCRSRYEADLSVSVVFFLPKTFRLFGFPICLIVHDEDYFRLTPCFICSNIPAAPAHGVYISQMIRYSRACDSYQDFLDRGLLLTGKLLNQGFLLNPTENRGWTQVLRKGRSSCSPSGTRRVNLFTNPMISVNEERTGKCLSPGGVLTWSVLHVCRITWGV